MSCPNSYILNPRPPPSEMMDGEMHCEAVLSGQRVLTLTRVGKSWREPVNSGAWSLSEILIRRPQVRPENLNFSSAPR